ncbi:MAG TPA: 50S ribosomal protein L3 [Candidatus Acidoferrales bacterium]|nr:50S ribosomal protein L3 [Candidatus Acidoferrales bacterium]
MARTLLARKLGMTQIFGEDGRCFGVTVLEAGPCPVVQVKDQAKDGYEAAQIGFAPMTKRVSKPLRGHYAAADLEPHRHSAEVKGLGQVSVGQVLTVEGFEAGGLVDVTGISKGKGFAGQHKRHNFGRGPVTHGSHNIRQAGSVGSVDAARTWRGLKMAGHMGDARTTVQRLELLRVDLERNLLLVKGAVPGAKNGVLLVTESRSRVRKVRGQH